MNLDWPSIIPCLGLGRAKSKDKADNSLRKKYKCNMMPAKVRYENNDPKPLEKLDLMDGEDVEIEIIKSNADRIVGLVTTPTTEVAGI
jgi:predicted DNA-binding antitoxin AbrB/MazE fold protein